MAEHTETVYASDSWARNYTYTTLVETVRGASLTSQEKYNFTYQRGEFFATNSSDVYMRFSKPAKYKKKRIRKLSLYAYITATSASSSGTFQNGGFVHHYGLTATGYLFWSPTPEASTLPSLAKNQYQHMGNKTNFPDINQEYVDVTPNVITGYFGSPYTGNKYTANASMTMHSHTGTNRPYAIFTYEDVVPEVRDCAPKSGFVNEKASTVFRWKFYANQNYVQQPVKQQGYQFRWRVTGQSSYKESTVTSTSESHTVPAGTFPEKGSIDWWVRVQSDD